MKNLIAGLCQADELFKSITKRLDRDLLKILTLETDKPGVTLPDASLIQHIPSGHQMKIWKLVRDVKVLAIRLRVIHRILILMRIETYPGKGIVCLPATLRIPTQEEVAEIIATAAI